MILTQKHLSRRTMLRGLGAAMALPALDSMVPAFMRGSTTAKVSPARMVFVYVPNGIDMRNWTPVAEGSAFELPKILNPLSPLKNDFLVLSGLRDDQARAGADGPGDHARASASFLTGVHPKKTAGSDIAAGVSVDQLAAEKIGKATRFASLELGCEDGHLAGNCDSGYSCAYVNSISWRSPTAPNPPEINPRAVFERLFGSDEDAGDPTARARTARYQQSILDLVADDSRRLQMDLGSTDRRKLDEYFTAVREVERQIEMLEQQVGNGADAPSMVKPDGIPVEFADHARLLFDLLTIALQTDTTRISTFMMAREGSNRSYREIGIPDGHHGLSHHRNDPALMDKIAMINQYHMEQLAYFLQKLKATNEGTGTLLDSTMVVYGGGISDGNRHNHDNLPVLLAGGANFFRPGRHIKYTDNGANGAPVTSLYLSILAAACVPTEKFGDSHGRLDYLSQLT